MQADIVFENGPVFRGLRGGMATAVAVADGHVVALDDVTHCIGPDTRRVDLAGRLAIPAFNEAHMHLLPYGLGLTQVNLRAEQVRTLDEALSRLRAAAAATPRGDWVLGRGYDDTALDIARHPTAAELDAAVPHHPVFITRTCGHMGVGNTAALRAAGIGPDTPDPEGGAIGRAAGCLTGLIQERALNLFKAAMPPPSHAQMVAAIEAAGDHLASLGFASATDMNVGMTADMAEIEAYRAAECRQRMWLVLAGNPEGIADAAWDAGMRPWRPGDAEAMLRWGAVKVFADGSAGGKTAAFLEPYIGGGHGIFTFPDATMQALLAKFHAQGWQLAIHAIGDAAIEQVLRAMEAAGATPERRHRIEHCGFVTPGQRARMLARGILPVPQPIFLREFGDTYLAVLGEERSAASYPMRSWLDEGQHPAASSDAPVSTVDPFLNLHAMTTRRSGRGTLIGPDQRLTMTEALHCYTWCGAHSTFAEGQRGTLEVGMDADIAIVSANLLDAEALPEVTAHLTLRGGVPIFDRHAELA